MKLQRLRSVAPAELVVRGRQALAKRLERIGLIGDLSSPPGFLLNELSLDSAPSANMDQARERNLQEAGHALFDRFWRTAPFRFFAGAVNTQTPAHLENRTPGARQQVIARADDICQGRFDLLGHEDLFFGDPVDWHLDPVLGRRAPFMHWSLINPLDAAVVGDSKVIWELNRHQWFIALGQAYRYTADERYGDTFAARIREWMQANPPGMGINWASSLEVALRLISWCWALFLLRGSKALSPALFVEILEWIRVHALHVERYLSYYFSPNTHLTGEALGLFYAGVVFPELGEADRWRALGRRILVEQIERQVLPDGIYFEQSSCYQRYTAEIYLHFLMLAGRNGIAIPAAVGERVQKLIDFLLAICHPNGTMPQIGDADGGSLLPLSRRASDDCRGVVATAAAFFWRADYAWAARGVTPEVLWLLGPLGCEAFDALYPTPPATPPSRNFADGGVVVMRSGWDPHAHQLIFDTGPLGCDVSGGHGHADLLGIQCAVFGQPTLIDAGTYGYTADAHWRNYFRSSAAHSTVMVDGLSQATPAGPFKWQQRPRARLRRWVSTETFDLADADHDAYGDLADPVTHRRRVFFSKPRYWVVVDDLDGKTEHHVDLRFQFAPMQVTLSSEACALARQPGGSELVITVLATAPLHAELVEGELDPLRGWVSPDYGRREPAPVLTVSTVSQLPLRLVSLLLPADPRFGVPQVVTTSLGHRRIELVFEGVSETLHIGEQDIVVERSV